MEKRRDLSARVNGNGNSKAQMVGALIKAAEALREAQMQIMGVHTDVTHGRNYQTVPDGDAAQRADIMLIHEIQKRIMADQQWFVDQALRINKQAR